MNNTQDLNGEGLGVVPCSPLEKLASLLEMPAEHVREAAENIGRERKHAALLAKIHLIRERNTAILPTGEIVARGTPGSMIYESPENDEMRDSRKVNP